MDDARIRALLEGLARRVPIERRVAIDPVSFARAYEGAVDREVAGLLAASLAYGRVEAFRPKIQAVLEALGRRPGQRARDLSPDEARRLFRGFAYRFHRGPDLARLVLGIGAALRDHGSLGGWLAAASDGGVLPLREALARFVRGLRAHEGRGRRPLSFHLLPDPESGSACKRLNLFVRWMVRPDDGVDLGLWTVYRPCDLVVPLDVHVARAGRLLGFSERRTADWRMAEEVTAGLARIDPVDPLRFDFPLSHLGMMKRPLDEPA